MKKRTIFYVVWIILFLLPSVVQAEGISVENETELDRQYSELFSKDTELTFHIQLEKINDHVEDVKAELFVTNIEKRSFIEETRPKLFLKDHTIPLSIELMEQDYKGANLILLGIIVLFMVAILMVYLNIKNRRKGRELNENESY